MMTNAITSRPSFRSIMPASLLVAGNVLGVGVLALPIKLGVCGYIPTITDIIVICLVMLISSFVIAERLPSGQDSFDIPSFFEKELGCAGRWIAILCNLIILYGVLIAYLSGISSIVYALFKMDIPQNVLILGYFLIVTSLIISSRKVLRRGNTILLCMVFVSFFLLIGSGSSKFHPEFLSYTNWKYLPLGLPVVISAFHFHNVLPTVSKCVYRDKKALRISISVGVLIGLVMNVVWVTIVLGTLQAYPAEGNGVVNAYLNDLPATVPMAKLLHSNMFTTVGLLFAVLAVSASYVANGAGLFGFIGDLVFTRLQSTNKWLVGAIAFLPPLITTLIYPHIFLVALDIVGGVGETVLFVILPGIILLDIARSRSKMLYIIAWIICLIGLFTLFFIIGQKMGFIHLRPPQHWLPKLAPVAAKGIATL